MTLTQRTAGRFKLILYTYTSFLLSLFDPHPLFRACLLFFFFLFKKTFFKKYAKKVFFIFFYGSCFLLAFFHRNFDFLLPVNCKSCVAGGTHDTLLRHSFLEKRLGEMFHTYFKGRTAAGGHLPACVRFAPLPQGPDVPG